MSDAPAAGFGRSHVAWIGIGVLAVAGMWFAYSVPGAIALFAAIGLAFVVWYRLSPRGAWLSLVVVGLTMASLLGWQAASSARCPADGAKVHVKAGEMPSGFVDCAQLRASAATMAAFFLVVGLIGLAAPFYMRGQPEEDPLDASDEDPFGTGPASTVPPS